MTQNESLYEATNFDGLERRGNYRLIAYREDVLHMLDKKDAGAIVWQIVYRWQTEYKRPEVLKKIEERKKAGLKPYTPEEIEGMMYVYMSYNDFVRESGHAIGYNTVIRMLDYLVNVKKVLKQRPNHDPKYPDFEYSVNKEVTRKLLKELPIDPAFAPKIPKKKNKSTQMGTADKSTQTGTPEDRNRSTQIGTRSTQTGIASTQMGTEVYPFGGTSHNYSHTTHSNHTKENTYVVLSNDENDAPTPFFLTLSEGTPLLDHFTLAHPLTIQIEQTSEGYLVSEPTYANHTVASTQDEALTAFKRSLVEEMHLLSQDESHLGKHLAEKLAFLRGHIREEVTQAETIQPANGVEIPHPERENSSFSEATQPLAPNTQPTTTPSPEFDSQREREALAQQEQQEANAKSEASDLRIAEETTNTSSSGESAREQKPAEYPAPSKPRSRRTKKEVDSTEVTARVTHVYAYFDTLAQEITGVTDYHYNPNTKSADAIKAWLKTNPTEELLHEVFLELWNSSPDPRTGFTWKNNMRIPSILKEYDNRVLAIKARRSKKHVNHLVTAATNLGGHTLKPEDFDDDEVVYQTKQQRKRA